MAQYADQLFMFIDGEHYEIASFSMTDSLGKKEAVNTMNPTGRALGTKQGVGEAGVTVKVPVRAGMPNWRRVDGATILFRQRVNGPPSATAFGAFFKSQSPSADVEGEQMIDVEFGALDVKWGI